MDMVRYVSSFLLSKKDLKAFITVDGWLEEGQEHRSKGSENGMNIHGILNIPLQGNPN